MTPIQERYSMYRMYMYKKKNNLWLGKIMPGYFYNAFTFWLKEKLAKRCLSAVRAGALGSGIIRAQDSLSPLPRFSHLPVVMCIFPDILKCDLFVHFSRDGTWQSISLMCQDNSWVSDNPISYKKILNFRKMYSLLLINFRYEN